MNKFIFLFLFISVAVFSQEQPDTTAKSNTPTLLKGESIISIGAGALSALTISYENAITDKITLGPLLGLYRDKYSFADGDSTKISYTTFGGVFNYHFYTLNKFDVYAGSLLGYRIGKINDSNIIQLNDNDFLFGVHLGGRYYVSSNFAIGLEFGYTFFTGAVRLSYKL